jgi:CyaY protein
MCEEVRCVVGRQVPCGFIRLTDARFRTEDSENLQMMEEQDFKLKADQSLTQLYNALAAASDDYDFDTDFGDALTIEFEQPKAKFVVSPNAPVRQIWVSAHSRSFKLDYDGSKGEFVLAESGETLKQLISNAVGQQIGKSFTL